MAHQVRKPQGLTTTLSRVSPPAREVLAQEVARSGCQFPHGKSPSRRDPAASMASLCCRPGQRSSTTWRPATELAIDSPDSIFAGQLPWEHRDPLPHARRTGNPTQPHHRHPQQGDYFAQPSLQR
jgi:hypothetical protein